MINEIGGKKYTGKRNFGEKVTSWRHHKWLEVSNIAEKPVYGPLQFYSGIIRFRLACAPYNFTYLTKDLVITDFCLLNVLITDFEAEILTTADF